MKKLIWRCDDFGSATGANEGIIQLARLGLPINVSVMICGPATFPAVEELAKVGPHVCLGVHAVINAEWEHLKWGPVAEATRKTQLVDANGYFRPDQEGAMKEDPAAVGAEIEAQIEMARKSGVEFSYLDEHMGFSWVDGIVPVLEALARKHGLIYARDVPGLPEVKDGPSELVARMSGQVKVAPNDGPYLAVFHPVVDDASTKKYYLKGEQPGVASAQRERELKALASDSWRKFAANDVELITYRDL